LRRNKFTRALIAAASLLGAIPLMAQQPAAAAPEFPYGKYTIVALDPTYGPPPGMSVEFTPTAMNVIRGGQVVESHGLSVHGEVVETFTLGGSCTEAGKYQWRTNGKLMNFELVSDPCSNRAMALMAVQFERQ
jgi:hypothetical protein